MLCLHLSGCKCILCKRDPKLEYMYGGSVTVRLSSKNPTWWIWDLVPRLEIVSKRDHWADELLVVARTAEACEGAGAYLDVEHVGRIPFVVPDMEAPCYVLSSVFEVTSFPRNITVRFKSKCAVGHYVGSTENGLFENGERNYERTKIVFSAKKPCEIVLQFLNRGVPIFCCVSVREKQPSLCRESRRV